MGWLLLWVERDVDFAVRQASSWSADESDHQIGLAGIPGAHRHVWHPSADHENPTRSCEQALVVAAIASSTLRRMRCAGSHSTYPAVVSSSQRVVRSTKRVNRRFPAGWSSRPYALSALRRDGGGADRRWSVEGTALVS